jgi:hypothetical protein
MAVQKSYTESIVLIVRTSAVKLLSNKNGTARFLVRVENKSVFLDGDSFTC